MRWISLLGWFVLCFGVAGLSGTWTISEVPGWYRTLERPSFAPPDWVFGPVWTVLYAMMAVAAWRVWQAPGSRARTMGILLFLVQLALNFAWTFLFFRQHWMGIAFAEIVALWVAIILTIFTFRTISAAAAWMLIPYLLWVTFASALNLQFWRLN